LTIFPREKPKSYTNTDLTFPIEKRLDYGQIAEVTFPREKIMLDPVLAPFAFPREKIKALNKKIFPIEKITKHRQVHNRYLPVLFQKKKLINGEVKTCSHCFPREKSVYYMHHLG